MVFTLDEMKLLQAIHRKSPKDYTEEEKIIVQNICEKNKESKTKQAGYFRKYLNTDKGKEAHRKASRKYYQRKKAEKLAKKKQLEEEKKQLFKDYMKITEV